jgi:formylglycine-generating enzyme required for sulfatase activity
MGPTVIEAHCFAERLGGKLPRREQWLKGAGKDEDRRIGPFDEGPKDLPGPAVDLAKTGPLPVGEAKRDRSIYGFHDMAGNGREWTRDVLVGRREVPLLNVAIVDEYGVAVVGRSYRSDAGPLLFSQMEDAGDSLHYEEVKDDVGFRVVLEER